MQVKTFSGASSQEVLAQIKAELGADAVILSNRTYRKNGELCHEIMAGVERPAQGGAGSSSPAEGVAPAPPPGAGIQLGGCVGVLCRLGLLSSVLPCSD